MKESIILKNCVKEYNKYHSPEAKVKIIKIEKNKVVLKFSGHYCFTRGAYDYFEDFIYLLKKKMIDSKIVKVYESREGENIVEIEISQNMGLINQVKRVIKNERVGKLVKKRIKEFEKTGKSPEKRIFSELCFCILTANFNAERAVKIQEKLEKDFMVLSEKELAKNLKKLGHRYPNARAKYIVEAREKLSELMEILHDESKSVIEKREWLIKNIKGLGYKEASHFLRNIGYKNLAIIDFHILDLLVKNRLLKEKPKTLTKRKYLEIENILRKLAEKLCITPAELDLYLWYLETGKIVK